MGLQVTKQPSESNWMPVWLRLGKLHMVVPLFLGIMRSSIPVGVEGVYMCGWGAHQICTQHHMCRAHCSQLGIAQARSAQVHNAGAMGLGV